MQVTEKVTLGKSNFGKQNTPPLIQKIGDIALISAGVGAAILGLPAALAAGGIILVLPPVIGTIGGIATGIGVFGKLFTKFFGQQPTEDTPTQ